MIRYLEQRSRGNRVKKQLPTSVFAIGFLLLSACSPTGRPAGPTTTVAQAAPTSTTAVSGLQLAAEQVPPPALDPSLSGDDLLVAIEARWMCDVQRFAFSDLPAMNDALDERLAFSHQTRTDYDAFKVEMEDRIDLRERVLAEYDAYCGED